MRVVLDLGKSGCRGRVEDTDAAWEWPGLPVGGAGRDDAVDVLADAIVAGARRAPGSPQTVLVGSNFIPRGAFANRLERRLRDDLPGVGVILLEDGLLAHVGALGGVGVVASVGTGTVVFGLDGGGVNRIDGWGPDLGDRGSAVELGRLALAAVCAARDGVGPATSLDAAADAHFGVAFGIETVRWLLSAPDRVPLMAGFAQAVVEEAVGGDAVASELVRGSAERVAASCASAARGADLPVAVIGRFGTMPPVLREIEAALARRSLETVPAKGTALTATWDSASQPPYLAAATLVIAPAP